MATKKVVAKKVVSKKTAPNKPDVKRIHELVDKITGKKGKGIIMVLDADTLEGMTYMNEVDTELVSVVFLGAIEGKEHQVLKLMALRMMLAKM